MEPFQCRHLTPEQVRAVYDQLLVEVEAQVLQSWQACVAAPHSRAAAAQYQERLAHLDALRQDCERLTAAEGVDGPDPAR